MGNVNAKNEDGYIVYNDSGTSPLTYGASERWFPTYDMAMKEALTIVQSDIKHYKNKYNIYNVIVYLGSEKLMHETHSCPCGEVILHWRNYILNGRGE